VLAAATAREIDILRPGEIAENIIQLDSEDSWRSLTERFHETQVDYIEAQMQSRYLKSTFMSFYARQDPPPDAIREIKDKCSGITLRPHYEGWSFQCMNIFVGAWLEVYLIFQEGIYPIVQNGFRVKLCKKCNNPFIAVPPQAMHCSNCRQDDTWQVCYWQKKHKKEASREEYYRPFTKTNLW